MGDTSADGDSEGENVKRQVPAFFCRIGYQKEWKVETTERR
jgi:hypothetical protein